VFAPYEVKKNMFNHFPKGVGVELLLYWTKSFLQGNMITDNFDEPLYFFSLIQQGWKICGKFWCFSQSTKIYGFPLCIRHSSIFLIGRRYVEGYDVSHKAQLSKYKKKEPEDVICFLVIIWVASLHPAVIDFSNWMKICGRFWCFSQSTNWVNTKERTWRRILFLSHHMGCLFASDIHRFF